VKRLHGLLHPLIVEGDAFACEPPDRMPVARLEAAFGLLGVVAEDGIVRSKPASIVPAIASGSARSGSTCQAVWPNSSRPMSMRRISEVPAPIS
jgi:hypothetical protein